MEVARAESLYQRKSEGRIVPGPATRGKLNAMKKGSPCHHERVVFLYTEILM